MTLALVFTFVGVIPMLVEKGVEPIKEGVAHALVGLVTICLAFVQPVLAFFRCAPGTDIFWGVIWVGLDLS